MGEIYEVFDQLKKISRPTGIQGTVPGMCLHLSEQKKKIRNTY